MKFHQPLRLLKTAQAAKLIHEHRESVVFVSPLLRAREMKMAYALRKIGWKVVLVYKQTTPFAPEDYFDVAIRAADDAELHGTAKALQPRVCHVFSGAVDESLLRICNDKPGPVIVDLNDVFCPSLFNYLHERFEPTRECLALADGLCARDLQAKFAERYDGFKIPSRNILFPEYSWRNGPADPRAAKKRETDEIRVVSVGTFCLETQGMYDSCYLQLARMLAENKIHLHIYPHWFYRQATGSVFNFDLKADFREFLQFETETPYLHVHDSLPLDELARELPQFDFGIVSGGCEAFGQRLDFLTKHYMNACYSGRLSDYLDARLPVLINSEVGFNSRILQRYGMGVDLGHLLRRGFREELLQIKTDRTRTESIERAAELLSLERQVSRLATFYKHLAEENEAVTVRIPRWVRGGTRIPKFGRALRHLSQAVDRVNRSGLESRRLARDLSARDKHAVALIAHLRRQSASMEDVNFSLEAQLQQEGHQLVLRSAERDELRARCDELSGRLGALQVQRDQLERRCAELESEVGTFKTEKDFLLGVSAHLQERAAGLEAAQAKNAEMAIHAKQLETEKICAERELEISRQHALEVQQQYALSIEEAAKLRAQKVEALRALRRKGTEALGLQKRLAAMNADFTELRKDIKIESVQVDELAGLLNWPEVSQEIDRQNGFTELLRLTRLVEFAAAGGASASLRKKRNAAVNTRASSAWRILNRKNLDQLLLDGYRNFKRTIALNYFTFPVQANDPQMRALESCLDPSLRERCWALAGALPDDPSFALAGQVHYRYFVMLLWSYACSRDEFGHLERLAEPLEGNPVLVPFEGQMASQDLANSLLEYYSMREGGMFASCKRLVEIGGGYGRNAYLVRSIHPEMQYVMVDIPPAIYIAQRYLSSVLPSRKIFKVREFESYEQVREEIEAAPIVFLLPHQLSQMPSGWCDDVINISSFGEMTLEQVEWYFAEISRLCRGFLYTKQWKQSRNPFDGLVLQEADYPIPDQWDKELSRTCAVQTDFFESVYKIGRKR